MSGVGGERQSCRSEPLTCGVWYYLWIDNVKIELNSQIASIRELLDVVYREPAPPHTYKHFGIGCGNLKRRAFRILEKANTVGLENMEGQGRS